MPNWQVEVLSAGTWNGDTFTRADLQEIAANFGRLRAQLRVPLKFGHDDGQTLLGQADGDPALGWVTALEARGDRLVATFGRVPRMVRQAVQAGLYRHVSSEIAYDVKVHRERIGKVLVGVALLGADLPAVSNLADLGAYLSARGLTPRRVYRIARADDGTGSQGRTMTPQATSRRTAGSPATGTSVALAAGNGPPASPTNSSTSDPRVAQIAEDLAQHQAELERLRASEAAAQDALRQVRFANAKEAFMGTLDDWVRSGTLTPDARDKALAAVDTQEPNFGADQSNPEFTFGAGLVLDLLNSMVTCHEEQGGALSPSGAPLSERRMSGTQLSETRSPGARKPFAWQRETAMAAPLGELARQAAQPAADSLAREAGRLAATGRFTLAQAQAQVLAQDPELATRWLAEVNHTFPVTPGPAAPMPGAALSGVQPVSETRTSRGA